METQVISKTIQKFNGTSYYLCGNYFQRKGERLHRKVWEYHNGSIPDGYHIHHKDGNRANNSISNLVLLKSEEHQSLHMLSDKRITKSKEDIEFARIYANEWHHSEEGKKWHSKHAKEYWSNPNKYIQTCTFCGKEYETVSPIRKGNHFCCNNHKAAFRRERIKNGEIQK